jgi:tetrahydromethanopterin S-methyltransferase subunit B
MNIWLLAAQASSVEAAGKLGAKFFGFWIIVLLILAAIAIIPVLLIRRSRARRERAAK